MDVRLRDFGLTLSKSKKQVRRLSDMRGAYENQENVAKILKARDPIIYEVYACDAGGAGDLSYAITIINPGSIGGEYFMTKGHFHKKAVAEIYIGLGGEGVLLLQDRSGRSKKMLVKPGRVCYSPIGWAHRAANTGKKELKYLAVYPSDSGHDYEVRFKARVKKK